MRAPPATVFMRLSTLGAEDIEDRRRIDAEIDGEHDQRRKCRQFAAVSCPEMARSAVLVKLAEHHAAIEPQRIGRRQDDAGGGEEGHPGIGLEGAQQGQELADEARLVPGRPTLAMVKTMKVKA